MTDLVRMQRRVSKKQYLKTKRTYEYERLSLDIPKKYHKTIEPLLKQDFDIKVRLENYSVILTLSPVKTFRHAENTLDKTRSKTTKTMI